MRGTPEKKESTIYGLVSRDWLAGVGGTCVCLHFILTTMTNRQLSCEQLHRKDHKKASLTYKFILYVLT